MDKNKTAEIQGYERTAWEQAKLEAIRAIVAQARRGRPPTISYSDLTERIDSILFDPHDSRFHYLLYEISKDEDAAGRGLLSALVVHKDDERPGQGFWDMARELDRDVTDKERCWAEEVGKVLAHCQNHPLAA
jgi:hypothetical protein